MRLERRFRTAGEAERLWRAVAADNPAFVHGRVEGARLVIEVRAQNAPSLRQTMDDLVACLSAAERAAVPRPLGAKRSAP